MKYKDDINITISSNSVHIQDSYKITDTSDILIICETFKTMYPQFKRSAQSWKREWIAHNWLYNHNICTDKTKSVDLNENESIFRKIMYIIIYVISYL